MSVAPFIHKVCVERDGKNISSSTSHMLSCQTPIYRSPLYVYSEINPRPRTREIAIGLSLSLSLS